MDCCNSDSQISYDNKITEIKKKYGSLLEMLIKEKKDNDNIKTIYSAITEKRLTLKCLSKFEAILERIHNRVKKLPEKNVEVLETNSNGPTSKRITEDLSEPEETCKSDENQTKLSKWDIQPKDKESKIPENNSLNSLSQDEELKSQEKENSGIKEKAQRQLKCNDIAIKGKKCYLQTCGNIQNKIIASDKVVSLDLTVDGDDNCEITNVTLLPKCKSIGELNKMVKNKGTSKNNRETVENQTAKGIKSDMLNGTVIKNKTDCDVEIVASVSGQIPVKKEKNTPTEFASLKEVNRSFIYHKARTDNMMLNCRIAHMKRGTVLDLVDEKEASKLKPRKRPPPSPIDSLDMKKACTSTNNVCNKTPVYKNTLSSVETQTLQTNDLNETNNMKASTLIDNTTYENLQSAVKILGLNANNKPLLYKKSFSNTYTDKRESFKALVREPLLPTPVEHPYNLISVNSPHTQTSSSTTLPNPNNSLCTGHQNNFLHSSNPGLMYETAIQCGQGNQSYSVLPKPHPCYRGSAVFWNQEVDKKTTHNNAIYPIEVLTTNSSSDISNKNLNEMYSLRTEAVEGTCRSLYGSMNNQSIFPSENKISYSRNILNDPRLRNARSLIDQSLPYQMSEQQKNTINSNNKRFENPNSTFNVFFKRDDSIDANSKVRYINKTDNSLNYNRTSRAYEHGYHKRGNPRPLMRNYSYPIEAQGESNSIQNNKDKYLSPLCNLYKGNELNCQQHSSNRFNSRQFRTNNNFNTEQSETYNTNKSRQSESQNTINDRRSCTQNTTISKQLDTQNTNNSSQLETQNTVVSRQSELHTMNRRQSEIKSRIAVVEDEFVREKDLKKDISSDRKDQKLDRFTNKIHHSQHTEDTNYPKRSIKKENNTCVCDSSTQEQSSLEKSNKDKIHANAAKNLKHSTVKLRNATTNLSDSEVSSSKVSNERKQAISKIKYQLNKTNNEIGLDEENSSRQKKPRTKGLSLNLDTQHVSKSNVTADKKYSKIRNVSVKNVSETNEKLACKTKSENSVESKCDPKIKRRKCHNRIIYYSDSSDCSESETINTSLEKSMKSLQDDNNVLTSKKSTTKRKVSKKKCTEVVKDKSLFKPISLEKTNADKIIACSAQSEPYKAIPKKLNVEVKALNFSKKCVINKKKKDDCKVSNNAGIHKEKMLDVEDKNAHLPNKTMSKEKQNESPSIDMTRELLEKMTFLLKNPEAIKAFCELASLFGHLKPDHESVKELDLTHSIQNVLGESTNQHITREEKINVMDKLSVESRVLTSINSGSLDYRPEVNKEEKTKTTSVEYLEKSQVNEAAPRNKVIDMVAKEFIADNNSNVIDSTTEVKVKVQKCGNKSNNDDGSNRLPTISHCQKIAEPCYKISHKSSASINKPIIVNIPCSVNCNSASQDILSNKSTNSDIKVCSSDEAKEKECTLIKSGDFPKDCEVSAVGPNLNKLASVESQVKCKRAKRFSELEKIQASLQSLPDYDNLMKCTGLRSCRIKSKPIISPPKTINRARKRTYKKKICASLDLSSEGSNGQISSPSSFHSNKEGLSKILDLSFEGTLSKPTSPSLPCTNALEENKSQDLQNSCTSAPSETSNIEIVDVFSLSEEKYIKSESPDEECFTIAKEFLNAYEKELEPSQILGESSMCAGNIVLENEDYVSNKNTDMRRDAVKLEPESVVLRGENADGDHVGWKDPTVYQQMLTIEKLKHFYKCMQRHCSFTHHMCADFAEHLNLHRRLDEFSAPIRNDWRLCAYCPYLERNGSVESYLEHLHHSHRRCPVQCRYCFYRGPSILLVVSHQNEKHPGQVQHLLQCCRESKPNNVVL